MNKQYLFFTAMGFELVGVVLVFSYLGQWLDQRYKLAGLGVAGALILGLIAWFVHIIWHLSRIEDDK